MSTRSKVGLPGRVDDYLLENQENNMPDPINGDGGGGDSTGAGDLAALLAGVGGDPTQLYSLLAKSLTNVTESNKQMQQMLNNQRSGTTIMNTKLEDCPKKRKYCTMDAWIGEVRLWDESNSVTENGKKYLKLVESVRNSEESEDLKHLVQVEFVENEAFDKKDANVVTKMLDLIKEKLSKTDMEKSTEAWLNFMDIKQKKDESIKDYVARYEQAETKLKNVQIKIPNKALAIHLMQKSNLESQSKENVLTKVDLEDESKIYSTMMKSMRELKSKLTANSETEKPIEVIDNKAYYGNSRNSRDRSKSRSRYDGRSRSKSKNNFYRNRSKSVPRYERKSSDSEEDRSGNSHKSDKRRGEVRDRRDQSKSKSTYEQRERYGDRKNSYGDRRKDYRDGRRNHESNEVNKVNLSEYKCKDYSDNVELIKDIDINEIDRGMFDDVIEVIYKEGNVDVDPFKLVVDCGCPKTVTGKPWMDAYMESIGNDVVIKRSRENESFKFGPSEVYKSTENYEIEVNIGKLKEKRKVSVVEADIPLLAIAVTKVPY